MKRLGLSMLMTVLLMSLFVWGVSAQTATPTPIAQETPQSEDAEEETEQDTEEVVAEVEDALEAQIDALQTTLDLVFLDPNFPLTVPVNLNSQIPISLPIFLPSVITTPQVITIPLTMTVALPVDDFDALAPLGAGNAITAPVSLQLVLTFETSEEINVMVAGVPAIVGGVFYTTPVATGQDAPTVEVTQTTIITGANLRSGPGTLYPRVGGLVAGQVVTPVGQDETGTWYQLEDGNWVAAFLVANAPAGLPIVEPPLVPPSVPAPAPADSTAPATDETPEAEATPEPEATPEAEETPETEVTPEAEETPEAEGED